VGELEIRWPDADAERVRAAAGRLEVARSALIGRDADEILDVLARVMDAWCDARSPWRRRLADLHPAASGFSREVVEKGLDLALGEWSGDALRRTVRDEKSGLLARPGRSLAPFASTSLVLAGAIPMPSLLQPLLSLALQSPVLVKSASRDPVTPKLLVESIAATDPEIARAIEVVSFSSDDTASLVPLLAAECVVASGSDETMRAIQARLDASQRFVAYGHRLSIAVIDADAVDEQREPLAESLSLDVALWDQLGCLSPAVIYVVGRGAVAASVALGETLADRLEEKSRSLPRGEVAASVAATIANERDAAAMRSAADGDVHVRAGRDGSWTVVTEADAAWRPCPLHRFIRLLPIEDAAELAFATRPIARHLSSIALAIGRADRHDVRSHVARLGASRICAPGRLQTPPLDWPHDGQPLLAPIARIRGVETD